MIEALTKYYDEGYEDGYTAGENLNPYDFDTYEYNQYEIGYTNGLDQYARESDEYYGEPSELTEWHDFDPDC